MEGNNQFVKLPKNAAIKNKAVQNDPLNVIIEKK